MSKTAAIIVAAGQGARVGTNRPKQYLPLGERSILATTLNAFVSHNGIDDIICVINPDHEDLFLKTIGPLKDQISWTHGGATRQESVLNGLKYLENNVPDLVLIHDAARPFVSAHIITNILEGLNSCSACLPLTSVADSLKHKKENILENIDRKNLFCAQTPQGFIFDHILKAHQKALSERNNHFTDDIAVAEWAGLNVSHVQGEKKNFKITTTEDYEMACRLLAKTQTRLGHGYDVHAFDTGHNIILCGVEIPFDKKLKGHSDADVGLHALTDAIYGSLGEGDIGHHFPPSEERWKGASSHIFLEHATSLVREHGGIICNLDLTLVCEAPKIGPHREKMRQKIAEITGLDVDQISVKATTSEGLGFTGRGEGIAAYATAMVELGAKGNV